MLAELTVAMAEQPNGMIDMRFGTSPLSRVMGGRCGLGTKELAPGGMLLCRSTAASAA